MRDLNKVELLGTISKELRMAQSNSGLSIANIPIATGQVNKNGNKIDTYHTVVCFGELADMAESFAVGDRVFVSGKIQNDSFDSKRPGEEGKKVYRTTIVASHLAKLLSEGSNDKTDSSKPAGGKPPANFLHGESELKPTFPFYDAKRQINWPEPTEDSCSFVTQGNTTLTCAWLDPKNPSKGGSVYKMNEGDTKWESIGSIETAPPF